MRLSSAISRKARLRIIQTVILVTGAAAVAPMLKATRTVPVVFTSVVDPVGAGFVDSLARPGGNATGFVSFEYGLSAKWLELLKEIAPAVTRVAVIRDPDISAGTGQFGAIQTAAPSFGLDLIAVSPREADEVERAIASLARTPNGGLITTVVYNQNDNPAVRGTRPEFS
jgi:ABC-type uncharacterized transport system substrate-binding protein